ncbi:DUF3846 domain-containing protein [Agromyces laixinhei]|uniref:DUF3846 domain-containing protein n=1 Tax=Agromyces laixinhei TaxID=2585717 RepID=UPI0018DDCCFE|nr:DUF3846 domain-containing protein [Agromyces laixinhei]
MRSIVIPHDQARSPRLRHLATASDFHDAVGGWLEPIEMPALGVTVYVNEAARREHHPINCRAMALWWLYSAEPMHYPIFLGDVVLVSTDDGEESTALLERIIGDIFEPREFVVQIKPYGRGSWHDSFARFTDVFDAATWCMLFVTTLRPGALLRLQSRVPVPSPSVDAILGGDELR